MKNAAALSQLARLVLRPDSWTHEAELAARSLPADSPEYSVAMLRREVESGRAKVCRIEDRGIARGWVVFAVTQANELVLMAAFGREPERHNLIEEMVPLADALARQCECTSIRFHTMRPGLVRLAQSHGYRVSEIVMRTTIE